MRALAALALAGLVAGCGLAPESPLTDLVRGAAKDLGLGRGAADMDAQRAALIARAQTSSEPVLMVELSDRQWVATLGIVGRNDAAVTWLDGSGVSLVTRRGVVIATRGLGADLMSADMGGTLGAIAGGAARYPRMHRYLSGEGAPVELFFRCTPTQSGARVTETCRAGQTQFTNTYDLRDGAVIQSRQWLGPDIGYGVLTRLN